MPKLSKKQAVLIVGALIVIGVGTYAFLTRDTPQDFDTSQLTSDAKSTSDLPSAQPGFHASDIDAGDTAKDREPGNSIREDQGSAGITDTNGTISGSIDTSKPITSESGEITVYSPQNNQSVTGEMPVAGAAKLKTVMYRVSDDVSGVIETGSLNVVNGKFSGSLRITTGAKSGQVSFFGTQDDGNEFSNVTIPLNFR